MSFKRLLGYLILIAIIGMGFCMHWTSMPGETFSGPLPPLTPAETELKDRLEKHVWKLGWEIGERHADNMVNMGKADKYIIEEFKDAGYRPKAQLIPKDFRRVRNLEVELRGTSLPEEILIIGAHYDSVAGCPGANDNATGVAGLLELARVFKDRKFDRTVRFVAFANEEPPYFQNELMGSLAYAARSRTREENIVAMISLETLGYYNNQTGSQNYPFPFGFFYPSVGNFIAFVGNTDSRDLLQQSLTTFRQNTSFPSEGVAAPGWITGIGWSDHWAFWEHDYPAFMVTDTALFRYPEYHTDQDVPDRLDYEGMARVINGLKSVIEDLASANSTPGAPGE